jgi:hypothetical protein
MEEKKVELNIYPDKNWAVEFMTRKPPKKKDWPITMAQASRIAKIPAYLGSNKEIALEYGIDENLVRQIREDGSYNGVSLR